MWRRESALDHFRRKPEASLGALFTHDARESSCSAPILAAREGSAGADQKSGLPRSAAYIRHFCGKNSRPNDAESVTLPFGLHTSSYSNEKNGTLVCRVRREEPGHLVVIKSQASRAQVLGIGPEIQLAADDARFKLHRAVSTISEALQNRPQVCQEKYVHGGVRGQLLVQSEVTGLGAKVPSFSDSSTPRSR